MKPSATKRAPSRRTIHVRRLPGLRLALYCIVLALLLCTGCARGGGKSGDAKADFDKLSAEIFREDAASDTLSLHIMLKYPENYGITVGEPSLPGGTVAELSAQAAALENRLARLRAIDREQLDNERRLTYDIMMSVFGNMLSLSSYPYMSEPLSPNSGVHLYLPLLLTEFDFEDTEDIETYLELIKCIPVLFDEICQFEKEKSDAGMFMSDATASLVIDQCQSFCVEEGNIFIKSFNERVNAVDFLDKDGKKAYRKQNKQTVTGLIIPAYQALSEAVTELLGSGRNPDGLCFFDGGREYYEDYVRLKTGCGRTVEEMKEMLGALLEDCLATLRRLQESRPTIINEYYSVSFPEEDPELSLEYLMSAASDVFPPLKGVDCEVKELPDSLKSQAGVAMYLIPAIDDYRHNIIYFNSESLNSKLFPTMAHEAYPGHMLQTVCFYGSSPDPVRHVLPVLGYDEGWATYCEAYSYTIAGLDETMAEYLQANMLALHCLYSLTDIGVNYDGWSQADTEVFLCRYGLSISTADSVRACTVGDPGLYLPYSIGYIEITNLLEEYRRERGADFSLRGFHTAVLGVGPAPFDIIREYIYLFG